MTPNKIVELLRETGKPMTVAQIMNNNSVLRHYGYVTAASVVAGIWLGEVEGVLERYGMGGTSGAEMMWRAK